MTNQEYIKETKDLYGENVIPMGKILSINGSMEFDSELEAVAKAALLRAYVEGAEQMTAAEFESLYA